MADEEQEVEDSIDEAAVEAAAKRIHDSVLALKGVCDQLMRNLSPEVDTNRANGWQGMIDAAVSKAGQAIEDVTGELYTEELLEQAIDEAQTPTEPEVEPAAPVPVSAALPPVVDL